MANKMELWWDCKCDTDYVRKGDLECLKCRAKPDWFEKQMDCFNAKCKFNSRMLANNCARPVWYPETCDERRSLPNGNLTVDEMSDITERFLERKTAPRD